MRNLALALGLVLTLAGCFAKPDRSADYGTLPADYQTQSEAFIKDQLRDPDSAKFLFGTPRRAYGNDSPLYGGKISFMGWAVPVTVNAKNGFGGYTGGEPCLVIFEGGRPTKFLEGENPPFVTFVGY